MRKRADDLTRLVDEMQTMAVDRDNFIKGIQNAVKQLTDEVRNEFIPSIQAVVKQKADETRQLLAEFRSENISAHEAWYGRKPLPLRGG